MSNKFEQLLDVARFSLFVVHDSRDEEYSLMAFEEIAQRRPAPTLTVVGVIGLVNGEPRTALDVPIDGPVLRKLAQEFLARVEALLVRASQPKPCAGRRRAARLPL